MAATSARATGLATRYATALFSLARERGQLDETLGDLRTVLDALAESPDLRRLIASPMLSRQEQGRGVDALAVRLQLGDTVRGFLGVLAANRRLFALVAIADAFHRLVAAARGIVEAEVVSAAPLDEEQRAEIEADVRRFAGKDVSLTTAIDPSLLGGLVVRVGSKMIDASLKTKLKQLELSMRGNA